MPDPRRVSAGGPPRQPCTYAFVLWCAAAVGSRCTGVPRAWCAAGLVFAGLGVRDSPPRHAEVPASLSRRAGAGRLEGWWAQVAACPMAWTGVARIGMKREHVLFTPRGRCLACADCSAGSRLRRARAPPLGGEALER